VEATPSPLVEEAPKVTNPSEFFPVERLGGLIEGQLLMNVIMIR
jgi:hypothetical protein